MSVLTKIGLFFICVFWVCGVFIITDLFTPQKEISFSPYHKVINYPINTRPLDLQCGDQPCIVFYDPKMGAVVALMLDGSTITVKPETR